MCEAIFLQKSLMKWGMKTGNGDVRFVDEDGANTSELLNRKIGFNEPHVEPVKKRWRPKKASVVVIEDQYKLCSVQLYDKFNLDYLYMTYNQQVYRPHLFIAEDIGNDYKLISILVKIDFLKTVYKSNRTLYKFSDNVQVRKWDDNNIYLYEKVCTK